MGSETIIEQQEDGFTRISEVFGDGSSWNRWVLGDTWIVENEYHESYERTNYMAYRAIAPIKPGNYPWTVNNRRVFQRPFFELDAAKAAVVDGTGRMG